MMTGVGGGGGFGWVLGGGEDEFPDGGAGEVPEGGAGELPDGGSLLCPPPAPELPPQPASVSAIIARDAIHVVVALPLFIVLTPGCSPFVGVTDWDKHALFLNADSGRRTR
jgi:hypothetical protein